MSHYKSLFYDNEYIDCGRVLIGNHNACEIVGIGSIKIKIFDKITMPLEHVRHVLRLKKDFFFGMLDSLGYFFKSAHGGLKIMKEIVVVMKGFKINGLYVLQGSFVPILPILHIKFFVSGTKLTILVLAI